MPESTQTFQPISATRFAEASTWEAYFQLCEELYQKGETTTDGFNSEKVMEYTRLNLKRMERIRKTYQPSQALADAIKAIDQPQKWLIITESWCGDAAQLVPLMATLADLNPLVEDRYILREQNLDIMQHYFTDGGKAIPIWVGMNADFEQLFSWGPRPEPAQNMVREWKQQEGGDYAQLAEDLHRWYNQDKAQTFEAEVLPLFK